MNQKIRALGYKLMYTPDTVLWHHRRPVPKKFFMQMYRYAIGRLRLGKKDIKMINLTHILVGLGLPLIIIVSLVLILVKKILFLYLFILGAAFLIFYFLFAWFKTKSFKTAVLVPGVIILLFCGWSLGFLKELLSLKQNSPDKFIAARVIAHQPDNWSQAVIIDKGSQNGIKRGSAVISYLGLAGSVIEAASSTAKVMLISDPNLGVSAIVQRSRQEGLVCGTLGVNLMMRYLPKDADIALTDTIVTSGLTNKFPKGLLIGTVVEIGEEFSGLSRYAIIKPAVNLSNLEEVLVAAQ